MSFLLRPARTTATTSSFYRTFSTTRPSQLARLTLVGRLGTDPEEVTTANGKTMVKYVLGTDSGRGEKRETSWFRVVAFPAEGTKLGGYLMGLNKGTLVYFEGDASMRNYEDSDGTKKSAFNLIQTKIEVLKRNTPREEEVGVEDGM